MRGGTVDGKLRADHCRGARGDLHCSVGGSACDGSCGNDAPTGGGCDEVNCGDGRGGDVFLGGVDGEEEGEGGDCSGTARSGAPLGGGDGGGASQMPSGLTGGRQGGEIGEASSGNPGGPSVSPIMVLAGGGTTAPPYAVYPLLTPGESDVGVDGASPPFASSGGPALSGDVGRRP